MSAYLVRNYTLARAVQHLEPTMFGCRDKLELAYRLYALNRVAIAHRYGTNLTRQEFPEGFGMAYLSSFGSTKKQRKAAVAELAYQCNGTAGNLGSEYASMLKVLNIQVED